MSAEAAYRVWRDPVAAIFLKKIVRDPASSTTYIYAVYLLPTKRIQ
jgi:hypothetical protein